MAVRIKMVTDEEIEKLGKELNFYRIGFIICMSLPFWIMSIFIIIIAVILK